MKALLKRLYSFSSDLFFGVMSDELKLWIECGDIPDND